jgi:hypothetical protein
MCPAILTERDFCGLALLNFVTRFQRVSVFYFTFPWGCAPGFNWHGAFSAECASRVTDPNSFVCAETAAEQPKPGATPANATKEIEALKRRKRVAILCTFR